MENLGQWITNDTSKPFYARKKLTIGRPVKKATAKVCGLGQFALYLNGKKAGDHELDPAWTDYRKLIEYVTFDVTGLLLPGENCIGAEVGNGWYIMEMEDGNYTFKFPPFMPPNPNPYKPFGKSLVLAISLEIVYEDGSREIIQADDTFEVRPHPVTMANVYGSETIDGRLAVPDWCMPQSKSDGWTKATVVPEDEAPTGLCLGRNIASGQPASSGNAAHVQSSGGNLPGPQLFEQQHPPVKVLCSYDGKFVHEITRPDGTRRAIYDFSQNMSGILDVGIRGKRGDVIRFYPAEKLDANGDVDQYAKGWIMVDTCITYIIGNDDTWEHVRMHFTYFAGRFIGVDGHGELRGLRADAISSAWKNDGQFCSDNEKYDQIYAMVERAVEANLLGVHTDCPQIERFAWQEPNHLMAPAIFYMKDGKKLWEKFFQDLRFGQHGAEDYFMDLKGGRYYPGGGLIPSQCPCYIPNVLPVPGMGSFYDIIPWGSTIILGVYWHYWFYGDLKVVEENYPAGMRYLEHLKTKVNGEGFIAHGLGDWGNPENKLTRENIETVFLYADTMVLAWFADLLQKPDDAAALRAFGAEVKENYNRQLLIKHPTKDYYCYQAWDHKDELLLTQAGQALPLYWGIVPEEYEADVARALKDILEQDGAFYCGEVSLPYVIQCARKYDMNELVSALILRESHPSYYAFILDGETTLGEYWENNPRSHCHDMMGHIVEWYYNGIGGIIPKAPGFSKILIKPYLPEDMGHFTCSYDSPSGRITVEVTRGDQTITLKVDCPKTIQCRIDTSVLEHHGLPVAVDA